MATLRPGTHVTLRAGYQGRLVYAPPEGCTLLVAVHPSALRAPASAQTQVVGLDDSELVWAGGLDEQMLSRGEQHAASPRPLLLKHLLQGSMLWRVITPGWLTRAMGQVYTVYAGARPWVVIGELDGGDVLAAPLNDARGNPKWFSPILEPDDVQFAGSKRSQLELAHLWSLPPGTPVTGDVSARGQDVLKAAIWQYFLDD